MPGCLPGARDAERKGSLGRGALLPMPVLQPFVAPQ